jgi:UDP:flavonoid glycosyltransferase YjiC (YdhE family)
VIQAWWAAMQSFGVLADNIAQDLSAPVLQETDLILNQLPGGLYGYDLAEKLGIPMAMVAVMPMTRTHHFPMLAFPTRLGRFASYNKATYRIVEQLMWQWFRPAINRWRKQTLGLPKQSFWGYFEKIGTAQIPILNGFSSHVVPRPPDWGEHVHVTGYWFPEEEQWQPPADLRDFIEAGEPPVFFGFGSMSVRDPEKATAIIVAALKESGLRGILQAGWGGIGNESLPDNVFKADYVPYGWLFPKMAAVVHHGGSGTVALGLRAGVPSLILPFLFDQFYWGERVFELGVGAKPIPFRKLSVAGLAAELRSMTSDGLMRERAVALGAKIRAEDGVGQVVEKMPAFLPNITTQ